MLALLKGLFKCFTGWPKWVRAVSLFLLVAGTCIGIFIGLFAYELSPRQMCSSHGFHEFLSPDGLHKAVLYEYDCGATTDFGTHVALIAGKERFDPFDAEDKGLLFTADSNHQKVAINIEGLLPVGIRWRDDTHLEINVPKGARTFRQERTIRRISINYVQDESVR